MSITIPGCLARPAHSRDLWRLRWGPKTISAVRSRPYRRRASARFADRERFRHDRSTAAHDHHRRTRPTRRRRPPPDGRPGVDRPRRRRRDRPRRRRRPVDVGIELRQRLRPPRAVVAEHLLPQRRRAQRRGPHATWSASPTSRSRPATRPRRTPASSTVTCRGSPTAPPTPISGPPRTRPRPTSRPLRTTAPAPPRSPRLQAKVDTISGQRDSLFKGETLRGLLLSSYAWATVGQIAGIAAIFAFVAAAVMAALVIAGLVHELRRRHDGLVAPSAGRTPGANRTPVSDSHQVFVRV